MATSDRIAVARGDLPADRVLRNARVVDVLSATVYGADIAIHEGFVVGIGNGYQGRETVDLRGRYVAPGLIDAHLHIESSMVTPREYARAVLPHGVTTVITNPHEIANVLGVPGIRFMLRDAESSPLSTYVTIPSCVPPTPLATSGAELGPEQLAELLTEPGVIGLGEVMNFPGVVGADPRVLAELAVCEGRPLDGHCPGLSGKGLNAYAAAGIRSDHECVTVEEAQEKLRLGMRIFIREGSAAHNLRNLLPLLTPENERWLCLCTDDRHPGDLLDEGSIDHAVRLAIREGVKPLSALRLATLNAAEHFRLFDRGFVGPGRRADLVVFSDLEAPRAELVFVAGRLVAEGGALVSGVLDRAGAGRDAAVRDTVRVDWNAVSFRIPAASERMRVIGMMPGQLLTTELIETPLVQDGLAMSDPARDLLKMAVIERHRGSGRVGLGFIRGFGLQRGAIAATVAHDHHNLMVMGCDDLSMMTAARAVAECGGGQAVAVGEYVLDLLPLPIAGLMSDAGVEEVHRLTERQHREVRKLGSSLPDPFMPLSFMGLEVIPSLKLTDRGYVDISQFSVLPLFV
ncbi:MAG: adenine deaminase [Deltaproteobacteria bacterium]|nr:adenine deaminase [Deltaproteobacteria bacterium]